MSFSRNNLAKVSTSGNTHANAVWMYTSSDDEIADIVASGYFNSATYELRLNDEIHIVDANSFHTKLVVTSASQAATVTTSSPASDLTATNTLTGAQSGSTLFLNSATEFVTTLPAPAPGLEYTIICKAAPASASYTIVTASSANILIGHINEVTVDDGVDGSIDTNGDTITFVDATAVIGDWVRLVSDGTSWYVTGQCSVDGGITITGT